MPRLAVVAVALILALAAAAAFAERPAAKTGLVVNMTAGKSDLHSFWMGLKLAEHALADGRTAVVYLNVDAAPLASKKAPKDLRFGEMPTVREQIALVIEKGGKVIVCPGCMKIAGLEKDDLLPGVTASSREALFGPLDGRAVVFSY